MDAPNHTDTATTEAAGATPGETAVSDGMDELLATMEAELAVQGRDGLPLEQAIDSADFEESIRSALMGIVEETPPPTGPTAAAPAEPEIVEPRQAEAVDAVQAFDRPDPEIAEPAAPANAPLAANDADPLKDSLEAVELELALQNQNLISLGFEESIETALKDIGGEMLFQMRMEREDCQRIAAVRIGRGEEQQFALVIMPPGGGLMRVEPVEQSNNPLALITESYASLMDSFRAAA